MSRPRLRLILVLIVVGLVAWLICYLLLQRASREKVERFKQLSQQMEVRQENDRAKSLPGDAILQQYASPSTRPEDDLTSLAHAFSNLLLLVKGDSPFHLGANEEFAAALRGKNRSQQRFVSDTSRVFNGQGQLIDRWDTPLYFHSVARDRVDIRSAGPDRQMWTADDLHRHYDGSFWKGDQLNPESLFEVDSRKPAKD